jgi:flagellar basal body-associated protein FliL
MFEPLDESENEKKAGSRRSMRVIWIVIAVAAVILALISFM